jgi:2-dehydro-3-deoxyphosphogluconate aldolase/(4S)-4-hydroxy-2-oxoglutarate aldolase
MAKRETLERIADGGVIPVVRAPSGEDALHVIEALREGGIDVIELTMTVPGALRVMEELARRYKGTVVLGAGTVLDSETARACILAGASFVVSPMLDESVITCCRTYGVAVIPGALTPTEIVRAWRAGADMVKVFPCSALGGPAYIKALKAPLPQIDLVPTGGVTLASVGDLVRAGASAVGAGGDLVDLSKAVIGNSGAVSQNARKYLAAVKAAREDAKRPKDSTLPESAH